jgi:Protein of unknown function (DUF1449)
MPLFDLSNLPYWILLGIGVLLFMLVIISGGGDDDPDLDADLDLGDSPDFDLAAAANGEVSSDQSDFNIAQTLTLLGIGRAPLILLIAIDFSLWGLLGWLANVLLGTILGGWLGGAVSGVILLVSLGLALASGGQIAKPIGKIFAAFGEDVSADRLIGCIGTVSTAAIPVVGQGRIGQVDVLDPARNLVTVNAVLPEWAEMKPQRGMKVLVIERLASSYGVILQNSTDQDRWFNSAARPQPHR